MFLGSVLICGTLHMVRLRRLDDGVRLEVGGVPVVEIGRGEVGVYPARPESGVPVDPLDGTYPVIRCLHEEDDVDPAGEFSC